MMGTYVFLAMCTYWDRSTGPFRLKPSAPHVRSFVGMDFQSSARSSVHWMVNFFFWGRIYLGAIGNGKMVLTTDWGESNGRARSIRYAVHVHARPSVCTLMVENRAIPILSHDHCGSVSVVWTMPGLSVVVEQIQRDLSYLLLMIRWHLSYVTSVSSWTRLLALLPTTGRKNLTNMNGMTLRHIYIY